MDLVPVPRQGPRDSRSTNAASPPKLCGPKKVVSMANFMLGYFPLDGWVIG